MLSRFARPAVYVYDYTDVAKVAKFIILHLKKLSIGKFILGHFFSYCS